MAAGLILAAGTMLAQTAPSDAVPAAGKGPRRGTRMGQQRGARLAAYLNLTVEQRQQMQAIRKQAGAAAEPVVAQLKAGRQQLADAVKTSASEADIERLATQQGVLQGQLLAIRTKARAASYALLTPEQRQKAEELRGLVKQRLQNRPGARRRG
jgi:Spy/CpxP family protein refolding chaperone